MMKLKYSMYALVIGYVLDLLLGDPHTPYHPACIIGRYITFFEKKLRSLAGEDASPQTLMAAGGAMVLLVLVTATAIPALIIWIAYWVNPYVGLVVESILCYAVLATKSLRDESMKVYHALKEEGLESGRRAVSMIVGRDTEALSEQGVIKAAVETIAENFSDGVVAPMLYMLLGGAVGGYFYKAVNTMDSMVGYKNDKYLYFGRAAAYLDDIANYIPSRLSALVMIGASFLLKMDGRGAWRIFWRDRHNHASPNSAQTEAVAAGALDVQLAGDAYYFGTLVHKPTIGDDIRPITLEDIPRMNRLMVLSSFLTLVIFYLLNFVA